MLRLKCWHGYLSEARCRWFAYGPVDATASPSSLASLKSTLVYLSGGGLSGCSGKEAIKWVLLWPPYEIGRPVYFCPVIMVALCNRADHYIFILFLLSFFLLSFSSPNRLQSEIGYLPYFGTWCGPSVNLECRSETCCARLAGNTGRKKVAKNRHLGTIAQLRRPYLRN